MKNIIVIVFVLLFEISNAQTLTGIVKDQDNNLLSGVNVYVMDLHIGEITDEKGFFEFERLPVKKIKLTFSMIGFHTRIITFEISKERNKENLIILEESIVEIEDVIISGGINTLQDRSSIKITSLPIESIKFSPHPSLNIALANEPGVEMITSGNAITKPVIRGLSGNRVLILYQGAKTANQAWGKEHGVFIPEEGIEKIEIIKGPSTVLFGSDAIAGGLNFIPNKPLIKNERKSKIAISTYSNTNGLQASLISQKRKNDWFHTYGLGYQDYADYILPNGNVAKNSRYKHHYAFGNWGVSKKWGVLKGVYSSSYTLAGLVEESTYERGDRKMQEPWQQVGDHFVTAEGIFWVNDVEVKPLFSYQLNHRKEFEEMHDDHDDKYPAFLEDNHTPALDMSLRTSRIDIKTFFDIGNFEFIIGSQGMYQTNTNYGEEELVPNALTRDIGLFSLVVSNHNNLQLQSGIRGDMRYLDFNEKQKTYKDYSFSFGGSYNFGSLLFRSNISKGFRSPDLYELAADGEHHGANRYEIGIEDLINENSIAIDFGGHLHKRHFTFDITAFNNLINNYIYLSPTQEFTEEGLRIYQHRQNNAHLFGGEVGLDAHPHFFHDLHYKITFSMVYGDNLELQEPLSLMPPHKLNNEIILNIDNINYLDNLSIKMNLSYNFQQNRVSSLENISDNYILIDCSVGLNKYEHELGFHINNLLNTEYIPHLSLLKESGIFEAARNIVLKYSFRF